ncbi:SDR family oxidoreductase [Pseudoduganella violacea]|uniref:Gluconate 5-dehydrogenase n=1 Tax=Pseudoduganella violacea TaxID=1715466 RepID=A0A7W5BFE0_9BURK|nr:SDR family oxidoreductase [Pseudoduganella violacea]MBB3122102.1 gluconate 5-dehydrogenase [Pseudoduganella violacea]
MSTTQELFSLKGKTALVTGGSRGLGLQMALALGEQGASVVVSARKQGELDEAVAFLASQGVTAYAVAADLSREDAVNPLVDATLGHLGHIDILVNNAGATWGAPAEDYPLEAWDKVMNLNVRSIFLLSQAVAKRSMIPRQAGRIINIASIAGLAGNPPGTMKTIAYNTSKAAVVNFTRTLAGEWGAYGINVNAIAPGFFPSKMTAGVLQAIGEEKLAMGAPLGRLGGDEDLKGAVVLFASAAGRHITGQTLAIDGGVSAV